MLNLCKSVRLHSRRNVNRVGFANLTFSIWNLVSTFSLSDRMSNSSSYWNFLRNETDRNVTFEQFLVGFWFLNARNYVF
jgi:hypothetical protein